MLPTKANDLTHWGRVTHICVSKLDHHCFRSRLVACTAPSHYLNQCWIIVNWTLRNKLQCNLNRNSNIFIQENAFESDVCETAAILSRPQCVNSLCPSDATWRHRSGSTLAHGAWRHQAITWSKVGLSTVRFCGMYLRANSHEVFNNSIHELENQTFKVIVIFPKGHWVKWRPICTLFK